MLNFLKELCTIKRKQNANTKKKVKVGEQVSAVLQRRLPKKCIDPGMFTISCIIGKTTFSNAMLNLGASLNVLPYYVYETLDLGPLQSTGAVI